METVASKTLSRAPAVQPAATRFVSRKAAAASVPICLQASLQVSSPRDAAEKEAEATAKKIVGLGLPDRTVGSLGPAVRGVSRLVKPEEKDKKSQRRFESPYLTRFADSGVLARKTAPAGPRIWRKAEGQPNVASNVSAEIQNSLAAGAPLPLGVRRFMEPRFQADFGKVKVHTGDKAAKLNRQLSAQAFTVGNNLFFGRDKFQPETREGKELIAHELTHTIQQGASVQRSAEVSVTQQSPRQVQRLGVSDALDYFADKANLIPGFRMFTIILGMNPINGSSVARSAANILRALIEFIPGGALITQALDNYGIFDKIGAWVEQQIKSLGMIGSAIKQSVMDFIHSLSWTDIFDLGGVWDRAKRIFTEPIDRIKAFAAGLAADIIKFIKDAILMPLAKLAEGTRGWDLLVAVLGKNPITNEPVTPTPEVLIGGFMKLIGQEEIWARVQETRALAKVWAWFQGAVKAVKGFVQQIPALAIAAFKSLELVDIVLLPRAFMKIAAVFGDFIGNFISWAGNAVWNLLEIIFDVVKPGALAYVKKTGAALKSILKNPLPFVGNLVKAAKLGFQNFGSNFLTHLKAGLIDWLVGALPGVYIPKALTLLEVGKFALSVLGITWAQIRGKIVKALGPNGDKIMTGLEIAFDIVKALVTGGTAAAWEVIKDKLTDLKDQVIGGITGFVTDTIVQKAIPKLISMFIPGAGFISAIISIYDTIMVFVNKISKIIQVVTAFIDSIVAIAGGAIGAAAARVESILAGLLSLAINFLAGFVGLGKVADKIMGVIAKVRTSVDKAIDAAIAWIITKAKALFAKLFGKKEKDKKEEPPDPDHDKKVQAGLAAIDAEDSKRKKDGKISQSDAQDVAAAVKGAHKVFKSIVVVDGGNTWDYTYTASDPATKKGEPKAASPPDKRYLPPAVDVRRHLYINGSGFGSARKNIINAALSTVREKVRAIRDPETKENSKVQHWAYLVNKGLVPPDADRDKYTIQKVNAADYDVDHIKPLAKHWVANGFNCSDDPRQTIAGSDSNLQLLLASVNRSKGGEGAHYSDKPYVGTGFSSDYNNSPSGSLRIKGQYFRDDQGKALK